MWRTADNRPVCFHCGRPGHVMRYCRERKAVFDNSRNRRRNFDDVGTEEEIRRPNSSRRLRQVPAREADPQYVVTDPRRHIADPVSRQAVGARKIKRATFQGVTNTEKQAIRTTLEIFWAFTKTDKSTAAKTNVKHRIFTGDHAPINQRAYRVSPTERRIIHEEVQKKLDEGIVQPSESPGHHPLCSRFIKGFCYLAEPLQSLLKSGVEFHWGPEEVEAFNSLKKALTSDPVLGMYDERASTEIHTDASGYGIGAVLVQIQNNEKVIAYASRTLTKSRKELFHHRKGMSCHRMGYQQISAVHIRETLYCCN
ncbi:transposon Ty3-I Gag-Pol polyprotein [Trichonephila clavipes]|nr:transposon Ty3-I Gag-Pol polyprotein [Trichonephila clavipes]